MSKPRGVAQNVIAGGGSSIFKIVVQLLMLPIMGHLLGPREFGLYATALPLVSFFSVIADGGLGISLAKEQAATTIVWSTAFFAVLALSLALVGLVNASGLVLSLLMHEPRLQAVMGTLSVSFVFIGLSILPSARLIRSNDLVSCAALDAAASLTGAAVAIFAASNHFGALSLAFQFVIGYGVRAIGLNCLAFEMPRFEFSFVALAPHINTGGVLVGGRLLDLLCRFVENLLFSFFFGSHALGAYTFATQVARFLSEAASNPIWSALYAQAIREPPHKLRLLYLRLTRLMSVTTLPGAFLVAATAPALIEQVVGSKWSAAGSLLQILAPSFALASTASLGSAVLLAIGRNRSFLATFAILSFGRLIAIALGPWLGLIGAVFAIGAVHLVYLAVMVAVCRRSLKLDLKDPAVNVEAPLVAACFSATVAFLAASMLPRSLFMTIVTLFLGASAFLVNLYIIEGRRFLDEVNFLVRPICYRFGLFLSFRSPAYGIDQSSIPSDSAE